MNGLFVVCVSLLLKNFPHEITFQAVKTFIGSRGYLNLYQVVGVSVSFEHIPLHLARINPLAEWPS